LKNNYKFMSFEERENLEINDTASFQKAIERGDLKVAEDWLMLEKEKRNDPRWLDHRSHELFAAYRVRKEWARAKEMIRLGKEESQEGRTKKLKEEVAAEDLDFDQI
jgi:hypothetical protein